MGEEPGCYRIGVGDGSIDVSTANLAREYERDGDAGLVGRFLDSALSVGVWRDKAWDEARRSVLYCLEASDHTPPPDIATKLSEMLVRVPVLMNDERGTLTWVNEGMLTRWGISIDELDRTAMENLNAAVLASSVSWDEIDGARLGYFTAALPFKSPLLLAPSLKSLVADNIGWPIQAVVPDRDFVYVWSAKHPDFAGRVGQVVLDEYASAPYPLSTELLEIGDEGMVALGRFSSAED